jgi:perosamine synthetase
VFSFYPTKMLTAIDGGAVGSQSPELLARVADRRYYSASWDSVPRYNYKLQNLNAAVGCVQLRKLPALLARRRKLALQIRRTFLEAGVPAERFLHQGAEGVEEGVFFRFGVRFPPPARPRILASLLEAEVPCRQEVGFLCPDPESFPAASALASEVLTFPTYPAMTDEELNSLLGRFTQCLKQLGRAGVLRWQ